LKTLKLVLSKRTKEKEKNYKFMRLDLFLWIVVLMVVSSLNTIFVFTGYSNAGEIPSEN
jgi:hypothetical protein